jgi:choline dehydrogenase-like flavoprotein
LRLRLLVTFTRKSARVSSCCITKWESPSFLETPLSRSLPNITTPGALPLFRSEISSRSARHCIPLLVLEAGGAGATEFANYESYLNTFYTLGGTRSTPNGPFPVNRSALSPGDSSQDPYFIQKGPRNFLSDYLRMLGGTTLHWQGTSVRMVPNDFRMQSAYGQALDWPISYDDLEAGYREAEEEIGVCADVEDQRNHGVWFGEGYVYPMQRMPQSLGDQFLMGNSAARPSASTGANIRSGSSACPWHATPCRIPSSKETGGTFQPVPSEMTFRASGARAIRAARPCARCRPNIMR